MFIFKYPVRNVYKQMFMTFIVILSLATPGHVKMGLRAVLKNIEIDKIILKLFSTTYPQYKNMKMIVIDGSKTALIFKNVTIILSLAIFFL